jgi:hypothetical protein
LLASTMVLGGLWVSLWVGLSLIGTRSSGKLERSSDERVPEITTAENIKWTRCEEDDSMFCTVFT